MYKISDLTEIAIFDAIDNYDNSVDLDNPFENLLSYGELVDRLSIVNFKLFTLKNQVMDSTDDQFKSWASEQDVRLVKERARLKKCIDNKINTIIGKHLNGDSEGGFNAEVKRYE